MFGDVGETQQAGAFLRFASTEGDQPRQSAISSPVGCQEHNRRSVDRRDLGSDQQLEADLLGRQMRPHHAGDAVRIGNRQCSISLFGRPLHEFIRMRRPLEKRKIRPAMQLGIRKCLGVRIGLRTRR